MKNKHSIFLILAIAVTIFVACLYAYMYQMIDVSLARTLKSRLAVSSIVLEKNREESFLQAYNSTATKWSSLHDYFVDPNRVVDFIETIESLSKESGANVTIGSIDADNMDGAPMGKEGKLRTHISAQGSWPAVMKVLTLVETLPYKITIGGISLNTSSDRGPVDSSKTKTVRTLAPNWNIAFDIQVSMMAAEVATTTASVKVNSK